MGTPSQTFTMSLDTYWSDMMIPSVTCGSSCNSHAKYNSTASSTQVPKQGDFEFEYQQGSVVGDYAMDKFSFGDFDIQYQGFVAIEEVTDFPSYTDRNAKYDGVFPLGLQKLSKTGYDTPMSGLLATKEITSSMFGIYLSDKSGIDGKLTIGDYDHDLNNTLTWFTIPVASYSHWELYVEHTSVGSTQVSTSTFAMYFQSSIDYISGPSDDVTKIMETLGAWLQDGSETVYETGCDYTLPSVTFYIDISKKQPYSIPVDKYLIPQGENNMCTVAIRNGGEDKNWQMGTPFMRTYNTIFYGAANQIGLQKA